VDGELIEQFEEDVRDSALTSSASETPTGHQQQCPTTPRKVVLSDHLASLWANQSHSTISAAGSKESAASSRQQSPAPTQIDESAPSSPEEGSREHQAASRCFHRLHLQSSSPSSAPASSSTKAPDVPDTAPVDREELEKLTMHQLRLLLQTRGLRRAGAKTTKADLVNMALNSGFTRGEAKDQDTKLRTTPRKKGSAWSSDHKSAFWSAVEVPKREVMYEKVALALDGSLGLPPPRCQRCGAALEMVKFDDDAWVGCMSYYSREPCGLRQRITPVYHALEERRKVVFELVSDDMLAVRMHEDVMAVVPECAREKLHESADIAKLQHPDLQPFAPQTRLLACSRWDYRFVLQALKGSPVGSSLRIRELPRVSVEALERISSTVERKQQDIGEDPEVEKAFKRLEQAGLRSVLRAHQTRFIRWAVPRRRVLCADDMGLGKTLQALSLVLSLDAFPALVVCPAFARSTWAAQIEHWGIARPGEYHVIRGSSSSLPNAADDDDTALPKVVVVSYTMLKLQFVPLKKKTWRSFILDESHRLGTSNKGEDVDDDGAANGTSECVATMRLIRAAPADVPVVFLTGTPAWTGTFDVYNQINVLKPGLLGASKWRFAQDFFSLKREPIPGWRGEQGRMSLAAPGACERPLELRMLLSRAVMIRRTRDEVMDDLPALQLAEEHVEVDEGHVQAVATKYNVLQPVEDGAWEGVATAWERVGLCKVLAAKEALCEKVNMAMGASCPVVVFVRHHRVREALEAQIATEVPHARCCVLYGAQREAELQKFAAGDADIAICMVESCGVAIDLSRASVCFFLELPHTASEFQQAIARLHRQGQRSQVMVYVFLSTVAHHPRSRLRRNGAAELEEAKEKQLNGREQTVNAMLTECWDRSHWFRLLRRQAEAMQLLGDGIGDRASSPSGRAAASDGAADPAEVVPTRDAGTPVGKPKLEVAQKTSPPSRRSVESNTDMSNMAWFLVSAETYRLHVYLATSGEHSGLITKAPVAEDLELTPSDFVVAGRPAGTFLTEDGKVHEALAKAATEFLIEFCQLNPLERRLIQTGGVGAGSVHNNPVPSTATGLSAVLRELRKAPKQACKRRYAAPPSTQQVGDVGTDWACASVTAARGTFSYRQRVDVETGARYCLECYRELNGRDVPFEEVDGGSDLLRSLPSSSSGAPSILIRYSSNTGIFCGGPCTETYFMKRSSRSARWAIANLEGGVCRTCKLDAEKLRSQLKRFATVEARQHYFTASGGASELELAFFTRLTAAKQRHVLENPKGSSLWEADHVLAVADGGGEADLQNFQTLCIACHAEKTKAEAKRRAQERRELKKQAAAEAAAAAAAENPSLDEEMDDDKAGTKTRKRRQKKQPLAGEEATGGSEAPPAEARPRRRQRKQIAPKTSENDIDDPSLKSKDPSGGQQRLQCRPLRGFKRKLTPEPDCTGGACEEATAPIRQPDEIQTAGTEVIGDGTWTAFRYNGTQDSVARPSSTHACIGTGTLEGKPPAKVSEQKSAVPTEAHETRTGAQKRSRKWSKLIPKVASAAAIDLTADGRP